MNSQQQIQIASISLPNYLKRTPWDERALGMETFEVIDSSDAVLRSIAKTRYPGHYTVKVDSLASKQALHASGFYYCDTLIEPFCRQGCLVEFRKPGVYLSRSVGLNPIRAICDGAFVHGRFHRDFNIDRRLADRRYSLWLEDLHQTNSVFGLKYHDELAGFWAFSSDRILLHALAEAYRGKGIQVFLEYGLPRAV